MEITIDSNGFSKDEFQAATNLKSAFESYLSEYPCEGEIYILNNQLPSNFIERDIDILVLFRIKEDHSLKIEFNNREVHIEGGFIFNIETKAQGEFLLQGNEISVRYKDGSIKNASNQAWRVKNNILNYLKSYIPGEIPRIYDYVYMPNCARSTTNAIIPDANRIPANFMDSSFTLGQIFKNVLPGGFSKTEFGNRENAEKILEIKELFTSSKELPKNYLNRLDLLAINSFDSEKKELFFEPNNCYTIEGSPGSGKTVLMLSKCLELSQRNKQCLFLTYNKQLVYDLHRLQENLGKLSRNNPLLNLRIETWDSWITRLHGLYNYFTPLGGTMPDNAGKLLSVYSRYSKSSNAKELLYNDELTNGNNIFKYARVEYVFIDEAQDLSVELFDLLKLFYQNNICLAVGRQQEFNKTNLTANNNVIVLNKIFRQKEIPSQIVNEFLNFTGLEHYYRIQVPVPTELVGGKALVYTGKINDEFYNSILNYLKNGGYSNIDFLHLHNVDGKSEADTKLPHYNGGETEQAAKLNLNKFRYYHYNSCRGLEGTIILYQNIDLYYEWCKDKFGETQAQIRLFIALTRVKDIAIFTFSNLNHWLYTDVIANKANIKKSFSV